MAINQYITPVQNSLESYIPLPLDTLFKAGQAIQNRGDLAQQQSDQVQTGLSSMEALAPAQRDYVNKFANDFKTQQGALLDKYQGNTSDTQYINEARKLNMQFASDPRLTIIKETNDRYKKKEALKDELEAKGIKYLDSNSKFTGIDQNGNLVSDPGHLQATNFDEKINQRFKDKENALSIVGNKLTNRGVLNNLYNNGLEGLNNGSDSDINEGLQYYKQKGYTDEQAKAAIVAHLNSGMGYLHETPNYTGEQLGLEREKFNYMKEKDAAALAEKAREANLRSNPKGPNGFGEISLTGSPLIEQSVKSPKLKQVEETLNNLNTAGGIRRDGFRVADTPENRAKYGNRATPSMDTVPGSSLGVGGSTYNFLQVDKGQYNKDQSKLIDEIRDVLGSEAKNSDNKWLGDKTLLTKYQTYLNNSNSESLSYALPKNPKYQLALTKDQFGVNGEKLGHDFMILTGDKKNPVIKSGTPEAEAALAGIKKYAIQGFNASPVGDYPNGSVSGEAMQEIKNSEGKVIGARPVTIIKPMDDITRSQYGFANIGARAKESNFTNEELRKNKETSEFRIPAKNGGYMVPQKGVTPGKRIGIHFIHVDENGNKIDDLKDKNGNHVDGISLKDVTDQAHVEHFGRLAPSIGVNPEKEGFDSNSTSNTEE